MPIEIEAKIKEIIQRTSNVKSFRLEVPQDAEFKAGQFCCVQLLGETGCKRYLSISNSPTEKGYVEFTKKLTQSKFSEKLKNLKAGDIVKLQFPLGKFTLDDPAEKVVFLSGGIGITPIRSIVKYVVDTNLGTDMILIYANRSISDIVFKEDFELMQKQYPKLKVCHVLCEPAEGFKCIPGLINAHVVKDEVPDYMLRKFFICGPPAMVEAMKKILTAELSIQESSIITENFQGY